MDHGPTQPYFDQSLRAMRIIVFALCMGVMSFGAVVVFLRMDGEKQPVEVMMAWVGLMFGATVLVARQVVRTAMASGARKAIIQGRPEVMTIPGPKTEADRLLRVYQARLIVSGALPEGAAFFNLICYMIEGQWWSLAFAGACLAMVASSFPSKDGIETWIRQQQELIDLERGQSAA